MSEDFANWKINLQIKDSDTLNLINKELLKIKAKQIKNGSIDAQLYNNLGIEFFSFGEDINDFYYKDFLTVLEKSDLYFDQFCISKSDKENKIITIKLQGE